MDSLKTLIKLVQRGVDEKRRELVALEERLEELEELKAKTEEELQREKDYARENEEAGFAFTGYASRMRDKIENIGRYIQGVEGEIEARQEELSELYGTLKRYEIVKEREDREEAEKIAHQEQQELDEIGITRHLYKEETE